MDCDPILCGDADLNGVVDMDDYNLLESLYLLYEPAEFGAIVEADMDCDGWITIADLVLMAGYVHGYGPLPCCVDPPVPPKYDPVSDSVAADAW